MVDRVSITTHHLLQSTIYNLQSTIYNLQSTIYNLQSTIYNLQSTGDGQHPMLTLPMQRHIWLLKHRFLMKRVGFWTIKNPSIARR